MRLAEGMCAGCGNKVEPIGVEYEYGARERYDGISEWVCPRCGRREGRWTGRHLTGRMVEPRFGGPPDYGNDAA